MQNGKRVRRLLALTVGALSVVTVVAAGPARAATAAPAAAPAQCHWNDYPDLGGTWLCQFGRHLYTFDNGSKTGFVIGVDYSVRFRTVDSKGKLGNWTSLGGEIVHSGDASTFKLVHCGDEPNSSFSIAVVGTNDRWYYKDRETNGSWDPSWMQSDPTC